jgi:hypothetical protein
MTPAVILGLCILAPAILAFILKVNAAILFMSLCVGEVLVIFVSNNATSYLSPLYPTGHISFSSMRLLLLLLPPVLTLLLMFHSVVGKSKLILDLVPGIATGLLLALLLVPILPAALSLNIQGTRIWHNYYHYQTVIVVFGALSSIVFMLLGRQNTKHSGSGHSKKH